MSSKTIGKELYKETKRIIRNAMRDDQLVLFVGAGVSISAGMPSWPDAINQIAERMIIDKEDFDYLKIPQYYYNSRGKKEYTQLMRNIFRYGEALRTTEIHKQIIDFNTSTIITTNYDHLIEQAAEENGEFIQVISQDIDLPYKKSRRELIKMHGDFEHDNFVLKEDDYLSYSANFPLIETYVKSLIGSKVVLFMGYSLNDPDVKQIITWVKNILKQDYQRAYLIVTNREENDIQKEYLKNLGVNIIYGSTFVSDKSSQTKMLHEVLAYLLNKNQEKLLDQLWNKIKPFADVNYVYGKYIVSALNECGILCSYGKSVDLYKDSFSCQETEELKELLWGYCKNGICPEEVDSNKLDTIKNVFYKSSLKQLEVRTDDKTETCVFPEKEENELTNLFYTFDFQGLHDLYERNAIRLSSDYPELYLQQAFISTCFNEYYKAYYNGPQKLDH